MGNQGKKCYKGLQNGQMTDFGQKKKTNFSMIRSNYLWN